MLHPTKVPCADFGDYPVNPVPTNGGSGECIAYGWCTDRFGIIGGALYVGWDGPGHQALPYYLLLVLLRIFIWGAVIHHFS